MPYISDDELEKIPSDPIEGLRYICGIIDNFCNQPDNAHDRHADNAVAIELHALVATYIEAHGLPFEWAPLPEDPRSAPGALCQTRNALSEQVELKLTSRVGQISRARFAARFGAFESYALTDGDVVEINKLVADLREAITASGDLETKHKQRVLKRLESLQQEIHKRVSDFDRIVGTICDVLVVAKKVGEAAEPWVRAARGVLEIVWRSQAQAYQLPSNAKMDLLKDEENGS